MGDEFEDVAPAFATRQLNYANELVDEDDDGFAVLVLLPFGVMR